MVGVQKEGKMKKRLIVLPTIALAAVITVVSISLAGCPNDADMLPVHEADFSTDSMELRNAIKSENLYEVKHAYSNQETKEILAEVYSKEKKEVIQKKESPEEKISKLTYTYSEDNYLYTIVAAEGFDSYKWIIDGEELTKYDDRVYSIDKNELKILPCAGYNFETEEFSWKIENSKISLIAVKGDESYRVDF